MDKPRISIIVAVDDKLGIAKNDQLLFKIKEDLMRLKAITSGHSLVMGKKTFLTFKGLLPNRTHIVITHDPTSLMSAPAQPHFIVTSLVEGIEKAKTAPGNDEIFVFGGGQIFKEAMEKGIVNRLYLTLVKGDYGADIFFPDYSKFGFTKVIENKEKESDGYQYTFLTLEK
jgi:dihydrofolate reductase